jgi:DNA polymerase-3 subunit delta'
MHPWNEPLLEALQARAGRFPHALLIHGARGTGKLALAERVAQFLLCEAAERQPCGRCEGCRWFAAGSHPDFRRVEPEALAKEAPVPEEGAEAPSKRAKPSTEIKIEQVRELAAFLNIGSHRAGRRVAFVHPAEDMNPNAANALLKGLEEPPAGAVFLLVSHRPSQLLPTIRSRCIALAVPLPPRQVALAWLAEQGVKNAERWLAYAGGAPLRALEYAANAPLFERLLRDPQPVDDREDIEALADALQKIALDHALAGFGLPGKYGTAKVAATAPDAHAWLTYARELGQHRLLCRHPLNPRLFSAEMLAGMPDAKPASE